MVIGTIARLVKDDDTGRLKGFGFIATPGGDVFFHRSSLVGVDITDLREGDRVEVDVEDSPKGKRAGSVRLA